MNTGRFCSFTGRPGGKVPNRETPGETGRLSITGYMLPWENFNSRVGKKVPCFQHFGGYFNCFGDFK